MSHGERCVCPGCEDRKKRDALIGLALAGYIAGWRAKCADNQKELTEITESIEKVSQAVEQIDYHLSVNGKVLDAEEEKKILEKFGLTSKPDIQRIIALTTLFALSNNLTTES